MSKLGSPPGEPKMTDQVEISPIDVCTWSKDPDEKRRTFIVNTFQWDPTCKIRGQIRALDAIDKWIKDGTVPQKKPKPSLSVVKKP